MTQFGRRTTIGSPRGTRLGSPQPANSTAVSSAARQASSDQPDIAGAMECAISGRLPSWTTGKPHGLVVFLLLAAAGLWYMTTTYAGDIIRDHRLRGTWQPAYDLHAADGKCRRVQFVLTFCSAKIVSHAVRDMAPVEREFMMAFSSGNGEALVPLRSSTDPSAVAIAYSAEMKLANRTITLLVLTIIDVLIMAGLVLTLRAGRYNGGRAHRALLAGLEQLKAHAHIASAQPAGR